MDNTTISSKKAELLNSLTAMEQMLSGFYTTNKSLGPKNEDELRKLIKGIEYLRRKVFEIPTPNITYHTNGRGGVVDGYPMSNGKGEVVTTKVLMPFQPKGRENLKPIESIPAELAAEIASLSTAAASFAATINNNEQNNRKKEVKKIVKNAILGFIIAATVVSAVKGCAQKNAFVIDDLKNEPPVEDVVKQESIGASREEQKKEEIRRLCLSIHENVVQANSSLYNFRTGLHDQIMQDYNTFNFISSSTNNHYYDSQLLQNIIFNVPVLREYTESTGNDWTMYYEERKEEAQVKMARIMELYEITINISSLSVEELENVLAEYKEIQEEFMHTVGMCRTTLQTISFFMEQTISPEKESVNARIEAARAGAVMSVATRELEMINNQQQEIGG